MALESIDTRDSLRRVSFLGTGNGLFALHAYNVLFSLLTLGVYSCWGRVRLRKYLYARLEFLDQRFTYDGNGRDLLIGFGVMALLFIVPFCYLVFFTPPGPSNHNIDTLVIYGAIGVLYPFAKVGSRRYLLRHLRWSGIRFSFSGSVLGFLGTYFFGALLCICTLGLYIPFLQARLHNYIVNHTRFGNVQATSDVRGMELLPHFLSACILTPFTLGLVWNYYYAKRQRIYMAHTQLGDLGFGSSLVGSQVFLQRLGNMLLLVLTLGLATPWIQVRKLRFITESTYIIGQPDLAAIRQAVAQSQGLDLELDGDFTGFDLDLGF